MAFRPGTVISRALPSPTARPCTKDKSSDMWDCRAGAQVRTFTTKFAFTIRRSIRTSSCERLLLSWVERREPDSQKRTDNNPAADVDDCSGWIFFGPVTLP